MLFVLDREVNNIKTISSVVNTTVLNVILLSSYIRSYFKTGSAAPFLNWLLIVTVIDSQDFLMKHIFHGISCQDQKSAQVSYNSMMAKMTLLLILIGPILTVYCHPGKYTVMYLIGLMDRVNRAGWHFPIEPTIKYKLAAFPFSDKRNWQYADVNHIASVRRFLSLTTMLLPSDISNNARP